MRKFILLTMILLSVMLVFSGCTSDPTNETTNDGAEIDISAAVEENNTVVVLATGGTIAGVGEEGKTTGHTSGSLTADELLQAVPGLEDVANIVAYQICNVNSDDITAEIWLQLANTINQMAQEPNVPIYLCI